jgi:hypothetical protein
MFSTVTACPRRERRASGADGDDFGVFQRCYRGAERPADAGCAEKLYFEPQ